MFKFKKYKKITSKIIIFIIADVRLCRFLICGDFAVMEIKTAKVSVFTKTTIQSLIFTCVKYLQIK
jgi:hypothetical protein